MSTLRQEGFLSVTQESFNTASLGCLISVVAPNSLFNFECLKVIQVFLKRRVLTGLTLSIPAFFSSVVMLIRKTMPEGRSSFCSLWCLMCWLVMVCVRFYAKGVALEQDIKPITWPSHLASCKARAFKGYHPTFHLHPLTHIDIMHIYLIDTNM